MAGARPVANGPLAWFVAEAFAHAGLQPEPEDYADMRHRVVSQAWREEHARANRWARLPRAVQQDVLLAWMRATGTPLDFVHLARLAPDAFPSGQLPPAPSAGTVG